MHIGKGQLVDSGGQWDSHHIHCSRNYYKQKSDDAVQNRKHERKKGQESYAQAFAILMKAPDGSTLENLLENPIQYDCLSD